MSQCWPRRVWLTERVSPFLAAFRTKNKLRGEGAGEQGLFVQSETDEMNPSSARYSLSTHDGNEGYFEAAGGRAGGVVVRLSGAWDCGIKRPGFKVVISVDVRLTEMFILKHPGGCSFVIVVLPHIWRNRETFCRKWNKSHRGVICKKAGTDLMEPLKEQFVRYARIV